MNAGLKLMFNPGKNNKSGKPVKAMLLGYAKATEINYNSEKFIIEEMFKKNKAYYKKSGLVVGDPNPSFDTYHPHFHILVMVKGEYFTGKSYISQAKWTDIWHDCMKLDYKPMVNIQVVKPNEKDLTNGEIGIDLTEGITKEKAMIAAISETFKYPMKPNSLKLDKFDDLDLDEQDRIIKAVIVYSHALRSRRLVTFGGEILKMRKILNQDDVEDGDLVDVGDEPTIENDFELVLFTYFKQMGCYVC
jgi:plasmid rolling circle replication initiator protein Rep